MTHPPSRYDRQIILPEIGLAGQEKIGKAALCVCGCGALGTHVAEALARAGVGRLRIVDRDVVEFTNLQRQVLFDERDGRAGRPKALAAAERLRAINSSIVVEAVVADLDPSNRAAVLGGVDLIVDGTDNFSTRFLVNDHAFSTGIPWVYAAAVATYGQVCAFVPGKTGCFRCYLSDVPPADQIETCDVAGVLGPTVAVVAALAATTALQLLVGADADHHMQFVDPWRRTFQRLGVPARDDCPCCREGRYEFLSGRRWSATRLCGRGAVQVKGDGRKVDLAEIARRIASHGDVTLSEHLMRFSSGRLEMTLFPDSRAIIKGTDDPQEARSFYSKYVGA